MVFIDSAGLWWIFLSGHEKGPLGGLRWRIV
jgi:hypothetical protein